MVKEGLEGGPTSEGALEASWDTNRFPGRLYLNPARKISDKAPSVPNFLPSTQLTLGPCDSTTQSRWWCRLRKESPGIGYDSRLGSLSASACPPGFHMPGSRRLGVTVAKAGSLPQSVCGEGAWSQAAWALIWGFLFGTRGK